MKETLLCIREKATALTRRSAGLPAMLIGVLSAGLGEKFFDEAILDLLHTAQLPVETGLGNMRLPQVHALNCLKDIFTNTRLRPETERFLEETLAIAIDSLGYDV